MLRRKVGLVCSSGGHFFELYSLRALWEKWDRFWVTFSATDTCYHLQGERVYWAFSPTNRSIKNFVRNLILAIKILLKERPMVIISTGAGVAVPFLYVGRIMGAKTVFIESMTRIGELSLSGKLVYPFVHHFFVQWPKAVKKYAKAKFLGQVI